MIFDLHTHSRASDGTLSPAELVQLAAVRSVDVLALTDHDVTDGLAEARDAAARAGMVFVPGVEISVTWNKRILHILGLGIDENHTRLRTGLHGLRDARVERARRIAHKLEQCGIPDVFERVMKIADGPIISRTHFARFLVEEGYVDGLEKAFRRYLKRGKPAYVSMQWASLEDTIAWISNAGGVAVIAHPLRYELSGRQLRLMIAEFKELGGAGIEVIGSGHQVADYGRLASLANEFELLASCGSDFHDPATSRVPLGGYPALPASCVPVWQALEPGLEQPRAVGSSSGR